MDMHAATSIFGAADVSAAGNVMQQYITPLMLTLSGIASLICVFFLITAGYSYMTSTGDPQKLEHAKKVLKNAVIGLVLIIAAGTLTSILSSAYSTANRTGIENIPSLTTIEPKSEGLSIVDVLVKAIVGLFKHIVESAAAPFMAALDYFTRATPLMGDNGAVFKLWLTIVALADALFVLVVGLLGFHIMSSASLGFDEIDFKHMLPQLALGFLLINTSIFAIDMVINLSNAMINAMVAGFGGTTVWTTLSDVSSKAGGLGLVALMIMVVFLTLSTILLVYYVMRLVVLYLGAILSPLVVLLALLPGFKDFASTAIKTYLTTVFVLFVHVVILMLAASIFDGMQAAEDPKGFDPLMATVVGVATLVTLLKTQGMMMQWAYVSVGPRALRKLGGQFMNGVNYTSSKIRSARDATAPARKAAAK